MRQLNMCVILVVVLAQGLFAADNLFTNAGFEAPLAGWSDLWTRKPATGEISLDTTLAHAGDRSLKIQHTGLQDWSLQFGARLNVSEGDRFEFNGWVHVTGPGSTEFCVVTYNGQGQAIDWSYGSARNTTQSGWQQVESSFIIGQNVARIQPRLIGYGQATVHWDDVSFVQTGNVFDQGRPANQTYTLSNTWLTMTLQSQPLSLAVTDKGSGKTWQQKPQGSHTFVLKVEQDTNLTLSLLDGATGQAFQTTLSIDLNAPELSVTVTGEGALEDSLNFPPAFTPEPDQRLVLPINEGIAPDANDTAFDTGTYVAYGGHGICMAFWGVTQGDTGHMAIIETPDDAAIQVQRVDGLLQVQPSWQPQKGQFGYARKLRYVFFNQGGYVAMCQRYRTAMEEAGRIKTLEEKRAANPNVDRLIGAVNVWNWDMDPVTQVSDMQSLGIEHILWSRRCSPTQIAALNERPNVLTSRYDIYQDLMDPKIVATQLGGRTHDDWTQAGWPQDLMIDAQGDRVKGWEVKGKDGIMYPCGTLCDRQAPAYALQRVSAELTDHDYRCRFIDTTTASPWRECYDPKHPMTRSDSRDWKMELLRVMSETMKLVTGSETGHDAAVPYVHYFEGMMSLGPFRVPDAGRNMIKLWDDVPTRVATYQLGHRVRVPLWELVYHDCVISQWYWGDYNNKLPSVWDKRDLFNVLYGTPPMFMFNKAIWSQYRNRFVASYNTICPTVRQVGYSRMIDHRYLTVNRDVQQTTFSNGTVVTVNFGTTPYQCNTGQLLEPMTSVVTRR